MSLNKVRFLVINEAMTMASKARPLSLGFAAALILSVSHAADTPSPALYRGYTIITEPAIDPDLRQIVYRPVQGRTVLEGLLQILEGTGYRLASEDAADPDIGRLYQQPYPENQRNLGPRDLGTILERLAGPAWQLIEDPVNRLVSFEVRPAYRVGAVSRVPTGFGSSAEAWDRRGGQR